MLIPCAHHTSADCESMLAWGETRPLGALAVGAVLLPDF